MLLLGLILCQLLCAYAAYSLMPWWCSALTVVLYGVGYVWLDDGAETGFRSWNRARTLSVWRRVLPVDVHYAGSEASITKHAQPLLYVVVNCATHLPALYTFGLHPPSTQCSVALPSLLFYVPLLRDALLCAGGVADTPNVVERMHARGRSLAFNVEEPTMALFELARRLNMCVVPVYVDGEQRRYAHAPSPYPPLTEWCRRHLGWPFPVLFVTRILGRTPPPRMKVFIGSMMNPGAFADDDESFLTFFKSQIANLSGVIV